MPGAGANNASAAKGNSIPRKAVAPKTQNGTREGQQGQQGPPHRSLSAEKNPAAAAATAERDPTPTTTAATPTLSGGGATLLGEKKKKRSTVSLSPSAASSTLAAASSGNEDNDPFSVSACSLPPPDFQGEVETNNELPSLETLRKIEPYTVLDADGKSHTFKSLYAGHNVARRVMVIFVRHFFCGNCQEYLRILSAAIKPDALLQLPVSTFIAVVGCGAPELIGPYVRETSCPFPVYTDPTRRLYAELGMLSTLRLGPKPAYLGGVSFAKLVASSVVQGLRQVRTGLATKMGDQRQVGGEFLFEPATLSLEPPIASPVVDVDVDVGVGDVTAENRKALLGGGGDLKQQQQQQQQQHRDDAATGNAEDDGTIEAKRVTWCHRMKTTRDHAEVPELMEVLGLEAAEDGTITTAAAAATKAGNTTSISGGSNPAIVVGSSGASSQKSETKKQQRYSKALSTRKGTGLSMAGQMSRMSLEASAAASIASGGGGGGDGGGGGGSFSIRSITPISPRSSISRSHEGDYDDDGAGLRSISPFSNGGVATALAPAPAPAKITSSSPPTTVTARTDAVTNGNHEKSAAV